jgi:hypothetical protein
MVRRLVFAGLVLPIVIFTGCGGVAPTTTTTATNPAPVIASGPAIYGVGRAQEGVAQFSMAAGTGKNPVSTFNSPQNGFDSMAVDAAGNIYATTQYSPEPADTWSTEPAVMIYAPSATGAATPIRTITGSNTTLENPIRVAVDAAGNTYVGQDYFENQMYPIVEFAAGAQGNVVPIRSFPAGPGLNTGVQAVSSMAVDSQGYLYVVRGQSPTPGGTTTWDIAVFSPSQNGNVAPVRTIAGPATGLAGGAAITLDSSDNVYASLYGGSVPTVVEFAAGASGNVAPIRTLTGGGNYPFSDFEISNPAVDSNGNIYVLGNLPPYYLEQDLMEFAPNSNGNAAPISVIAVENFFVGGNITVH